MVAQRIYQELAEDPHENVVIRFRGKELLCDGCLRITVGTPTENDLLVKKWTEIVGRF
jgi:histidinol-phosphate aminotransferase